MNSYCVFNVGGRRVGLSMAHVREIVEQDQVQTVPVPLVPPFVRGLFNLRGQVLPYLDLSPFVGTQPGTEYYDRAIVVERGEFRFATPGVRVDTMEADPATFEPLSDAALFPAPDAAVRTERDTFDLIHLERLEACLGQALQFGELANAAT